MEFAQELGKGERALFCPKSLVPSLCFIDTPTSSPLRVAKLHPNSDLLLFLLWPRAVNTRQKAGQHEPITPPFHPSPICGLSRCLGPPATATCYPNSFLPLLGLSMWAPSLGPLLSSGSAGRRRKVQELVLTERGVWGSRCGMRNPLQMSIPAYF